MSLLMIESRLLRLITLAAAVLLSGCTVVVGEQPGKYPPAPPPQPVAETFANGTIYQASTANSLFVDVKARRVGDTITILLNERTQASKSASTDATKESDFDSGSPTIFGNTPKLNGENVFENSWETSQEFAGSGSSSQSHRTLAATTGITDGKKTRVR